MVRLILAAASIAVLAVPAAAAPCRDAKGHFMKCTSTTTTKTVTTTKTTATRCKDAKGKFAKCGTPGAKPV